MALMLGVVNDVFNDVGTHGLIACHAALSHQSGVVLSSHFGTVAVLDEWSIVPTSHCSHTVDACPHALQVLTTLLARTSCRRIMALT
jgi:hypothetical protein